MKKDIEWLKKELNLIEYEAQKILDKYDDRGPTVYRFEERLHSVNIFRHLLDQLDEPETLSQEWIDENKKYEGVYDIGYYIPVNKLYGKVVPKQEEQSAETDSVEEVVADFGRALERLRKLWRNIGGEELEE